MRAPFGGILVLFLIPSLICVALAGGPTWPEYRGAWFSIEYPPEFRPHPSLPSTTTTHGYDSAFFRSPDGAVQFYVYSPQWGGEATDVDLDPARETLVSEKTTDSGATRTTWRTFAAKNRKYTRSLVHTRKASSGTDLVFGIQYRDQSAYKTYRDAYLRFKGSLRQYAD